MHWNAERPKVLQKHQSVYLGMGSPNIQNQICGETTCWVSSDKLLSKAVYIKQRDETKVS